MHLARHQGREASLEEMETMMTATATATGLDVLATLLLPQKFAIPRLFNAFHAVNPRKLQL